MPRPNAPKLIERYRALRLWRWPTRGFMPYQLRTERGAHRGWFQQSAQAKRAMREKR